MREKIRCIYFNAFRNKALKARVGPALERLLYPYII